MAEALYRSLARKLCGLAARCVLKLLNDGCGVQEAQVALLAGETADGVERFQNYGFTSCPLPGAEGVCLFLGADRAHGVVLAMDDRRYRLTGLAPGEAALYTDEGARIVLKRGRVIEATCDVFRIRADSRVELLAPEVVLGGANGGPAQATLAGTLSATGDLAAGGVRLRSHTHSGVEPGEESTGAPNGGAA